MRVITAAVITLLFVVLTPRAALGQSSSQSANAVTVPRVVNISGVFAPAEGQRPGVEVVTLAVYAEETGGNALWSETQTITVDASGRYALLLGATHTEGV